MKRTLRQNRALHLWLRKLAEALEEAGYDDLRTVITVPIAPTPELLKETVWRKVQLAMYPDKPSTADLETDEMQKVFETLNRALGDRLGIHVPWPSEAEMTAEFYERQKPDFICRR